MKRIIIWTAIVCLLLTAAVFARADEEGLADKLLNESGWTLWEMSWGLNTDFEMCTPEEMGGETILGLSRSGKGFVYSEKGTLTFDWSEKRSGGANMDMLTSAEKAVLGFMAPSERLEIDNGRAVIESFMGGLKVYGWMYGSIGEGGFASCGISLLSLPDFPIKVDKDAFGGAAMTEVIIPGGMKKIAARMFEGCWYLEKVTIGEGIEAIENEAFANCQALSEVILPSTLRSIGNGAFSRSTAISAVSVPEGVRTLGEEAFLGCSALRLIVLPESLESIGTNAFFGCAELNELHIPGAQTQIADYILNREKTVIIGSAGSTAQAHAQQRRLEFREDAGAAVSTGVSNTDDFLLNERRDGTLCITLYKGPGGAVVVPDSVNGKKIAAVGAEAFSGNESVQSVVLPDSVLEIGDKAFFSCKNLERVRIPAEAAQFGRFIFTNCPKLVVQVAAGSQAEAYADANRLKKDVR